MGGQDGDHWGWWISSVSHFYCLTRRACSHIHNCKVNIVGQCSPKLKPCYDLLHHRKQMFYSPPHSHRLEVNDKRRLVTETFAYVWPCLCEYTIREYALHVAILVMGECKLRHSLFTITAEQVAYYLLMTWCWKDKWAWTIEWECSWKTKEELVLLAYRCRVGFYQHDEPFHKSI